METLTDRPGEMTDYWTAAVKFYAAGATAPEMRSAAASPAYVNRIASESGITPAEAVTALLALARAIDSYTAEGMTREGAYYLAGFDKLNGRTFEEFTAAVAAEAA